MSPRGGRLGIFAGAATGAARGCWLRWGAAGGASVSIGAHGVAGSGQLPAQQLQQQGGGRHASACCQGLQVFRFAGGYAKGK